MQKNIRQSMAWLHSWTGLLLGRLLFAIFLMGSMSYYRHEITMWMQPELAQYNVAQETALKTAYQYLDVHAHDAKSWYIGVASEKSPVNNVYWQKADGGFERKTLNPPQVRSCNYLRLKAAISFMNFISTFWRTLSDRSHHCVYCCLYHVDCFGFGHYHA